MPWPSSSPSSAGADLPRRRPAAGGQALRRGHKALRQQIRAHVAAEKPWEFGPLARAKADSPTTAEALVFTRSLDYDVAVVADNARDFGDYLAYRTWDPRLVAGTQGLVRRHGIRHLRPGARRRRRTASPHLRSAHAPLDYQVWMAVRAVGKAITPTKVTDPGRVKKAIHHGGIRDSPAIPGVSLSFRPWDQQLRQPLLLASRALSSRWPGAGLPAPAHAARHPWLRSAGDRLQARNDITGRMPCRRTRRSRTVLAAWGSHAWPPTPAPTRSTSRTRRATRSRSSTPSTMAVIGTWKVGRRPRGITMSLDGKGSTSARATTTASTWSTRRPARWCARSVRSRSRAVHPRPRGNPLYIANEDDNQVTVVDVEKNRSWPRCRSGSSRREWASVPTARSW